MLACAMSDQAGMSEFVEDLASDAICSLVDRSASSGSLHSAYGMKHKLIVPTLNIDAFTNSCRNKQVFVKIDVEDAEDKVFAGGHAFFADVMPMFLLNASTRRVWLFLRIWIIPSANSGSTQITC